MYLKSINTTNMLDLTSILLAADAFYIMFVKSSNIAFCERFSEHESLPVLRPLPRVGAASGMLAGCWPGYARLATSSKPTLRCTRGFLATRPIESRRGIQASHSARCSSTSFMEAAERIEDGLPVPANLELISGNRLGNLCRDHRALQPAQQ